LKNLNIYRNDVIIYKINNYNNIIINKYLKDILSLIESKKIKIIFCVWTYFLIKNTLSLHHNLITHLDKLNLKIKTLCHVHDFFTVLRNYSNLNNINNFLEIGFKEQISIFSGKKNIYEIMHCATKNFIKTFNNSPINKIFLSGDINKVAYSHRNNFHKYYLQNKSKIDYKQHPGQLIKDDNYPDELNSYIACFYSSRDVKELEDNMIILAKAFEIPATGSLLLAHESCKNSLLKVGFIENINCMFINENNYDKVIDYILDKNNRYEIDEIRKKGQELILKNHTEDNRINEINKILDNILIE
jgi:phosphotransferase system IIB component